ncbi:TPA: KrfA [Escherichia coli]|nr:KrfA [Escherichia coli]
MAITKQDIWRAADELDAEGIRPTLAAVRKKLGSGSFTTISDAMAEWKNRKTATLPSSDPLPVAVNEHLAELGNALWAIALAHANARFDEDRKQIEADKAAISQQLAEVKRRSGEELNRCMEKLTQRDNEAIEARKQAKEAIERAASLQGQVEALKEQVANLTAVLKTGGKQ